MELPPIFLTRLHTCVTAPSFMVGFNGTVQCYFRSTRGLRQGDLYPFYLFVVAMDCLSRMLDKAAEDGKFGYHYNSKESKLTHLCFTDDHLIFLEGSLESLKSMLSIHDEFKELSGLAINVSKTSFFTSGLSPSKTDQIKSETCLSHGQLPVHYLGVPLCTKKLSMVNCEPLIKQVKRKVNSWTSKSLSFVGRLLFINTTIASISNFWFATFTIPDYKLNAYLWKGTTEKHYSVRVSWNTVTLYKKERED